MLFEPHGAGRQQGLKQSRLGWLSLWRVLFNCDCYLARATRLDTQKRYAQPCRGVSVTIKALYGICDYADLIKMMCGILMRRPQQRFAREGASHLYGPGSWWVSFVKKPSQMPLHSTMYHTYSLTKLFHLINIGRYLRGLRAPKSVKLKSYFLVPRLRVKNFFGREEQLKQVTSYFEVEVERPQILVLHALGGQRKSQIALKYCQQARKSFRGVF